MKLSWTLCLAVLVIVLGTSAASGAVVGPKGNGPWVVWADDGGKVAPYYDAMHIGDGGDAANHDFTHNAAKVSWIYKSKFFEVGEQVANSYYIRWTRFEFAAAATTDQFVAQSGQTTWTDHSAPGICYDTFKTIYEGSYTQLIGGVQAIKFTEEFRFYGGWCGGNDYPDNYYFAIWTPESTDSNDNFFWRVVTIENPDMNNKDCMNAYVYDFNAADNGNWVQIQENSLAPTPPLGGPKFEAGCGQTPTRRDTQMIPTFHSPVGVFSINMDAVWLFDRRPDEILHNGNGGAGENWGFTTDTTDKNIVIMYDFEDQVYYNVPDYGDWNIWVRHYLENF